MYAEQIRGVNEAVKNYNPKRLRLKNLDLFMLDNSLRETTVGQLRGHTLENKWKIYKEVKRVGFKHMIIEAFSHRTRLGDTFINQLKEAGEDMEYFYAFTEFFETIDKNKVPKKDLPIGLIKMEELGIKNVLMEVDLVYHGIDYSKFNVTKMCALFSERFKWIREHLAPDSRILINLRDMPDCMKKKPKRLFAIVNYLSSLPPEERIFGIIFEEIGKYYPEEVGIWTAAVRKEMDRCGFQSGHLLVHVHQKWGMMDMMQLECLSKGANGIWAGLCEEGAAMGHASACLTILNLVRMGNQKVVKNFNCTQLRSAAQNVTQITTGKPPHPKQAVYGARALDLVFGLDQSDPSSKEFNLARFLGEEPVMRISTLASPEMVAAKLTKVFGDDPQFTEKMGNRMLEVMLEDLRDNRKEEYHSKLGLAMLFDRSGGKLTAPMSDVIAEVEPKLVHIQEMIAEIRSTWDEWDLRDGVLDDALEFDAFYNGFMAPYFGCYRCDETKKALQAIDMDSDGKVDWNEFAVYLKWAGNEYPQTPTAEDLMDIAFRKGLVPAMQEEVLKSLPPPDTDINMEKEEDEEEDDYQYCGSDDEDDFFDADHVPTDLVKRKKK